MSANGVDVSAIEGTEGNPLASAAGRESSALQGKSLDDLILIAQAGGRLRVDARRYSVEDLLDLALALTPEGALTLANSEGKSTAELVSIVAAAPGRVTIA